MHRICALLASLLAVTAPALAADLDQPLLARVEHGVNIWAPPPLPSPPPVPAAVAVSSPRTDVRVTVIHVDGWLDDGYAHGERWPGYMGHYPARFPF